MAGDRTHSIVKIDLDQASLAATTADAEHERRVAIFDLLESNVFKLEDHSGGPYQLFLSTADNRLNFHIRDEDGEDVRTLMLSLTPFRSIVKDYFLICENYYEAIRTASPDKIEAVDMGRRALHNEGSELLVERLKGKCELDFDTSRRLFTLVCALHRPR